MAVARDSASWLLGDALIAQRRPVLVSAATGVALVFTVVLDIVLIPELGGWARRSPTVFATVAGLAVAAVFLRGLDVRPGDLLWHRGDLSFLSVRLVRRLRWGLSVTISQTLGAPPAVRRDESRRRERHTPWSVSRRPPSRTSGPGLRIRHEIERPSPDTVAGWASSTRPRSPT